MTASSLIDRPNPHKKTEFPVTNRITAALAHPVRGRVSAYGTAWLCAACIALVAPVCGSRPRARPKGRRFVSLSDSFTPRNKQGAGPIDADPSVLRARATR